MANRRYTYRGPLSGFSLAVAPGKGAEPRVLDVVLVEGEEPRVDGKPAPLPEDSEHVRTLVAQGHLVPVPEVQGHPDPVPEPERAPSPSKRRSGGGKPKADKEND